MITVFEISRIKSNGDEEDEYTTDKIRADKFVFDSLFMDEVEFTYKKIKMTEEEYHAELKRRAKAFDREVMKATKCL